MEYITNLEWNQNLAVIRTIINIKHALVIESKKYLPKAKSDMLSTSRQLFHHARPAVRKATISGYVYYYPGKPCNEFAWSSWINFMSLIVADLSYGALCIPTHMWIQGSE
jgi:hypothetical protein